MGKKNVSEKRESSERRIRHFPGSQTLLKKKKCNNHLSVQLLSLDVSTSAFAVERTSYINSKDEAFLWWEAPDTVVYIYVKRKFHWVLREEKPSEQAKRVSAFGGKKVLMFIN